MSELDVFFEPDGIAVIGATDTPSKLGNIIARRLIENARSGVLSASVFPVNPSDDTVEGERCYDSVTAIDEDVDLAVIVIPAPHVPDVIDECGEKGVDGAVIITGGFGELGEEGKRLEREIADRAAGHGIRVIGPNCVGIFDATTGIDTTFIPEDRMDRPDHGPTSFVSQSGAFVTTMLDWASMQDLGMNKVVSYGNKLDVNDADMLEYLKDDEGTGVITMYIEGIDDGREFLETASAVTREKPVIAVKSGRSETGAAAASSHTGSLAGSDDVYSAAFEQAGVLRAEDFFHMFDLARAFGNQPLPDGPNVGIVTNGGGAGVMAADALAENGLTLPELTPETTEAIREEFPPHAIVGNPTDVVGDTDKHRYEVAIDAMLDDETLSALLVILLFQSPRLEYEVVESVAGFSAETDKPIIAVAMGGENTKPHAEKLERLGVPTYPGPRRAARALGGLVQYAEYRREEAEADSQEAIR